MYALQMLAEKNKTNSKKYMQSKMRKKSDKEKEIENSKWWKKS